MLKTFLKSFYEVKIYDINIILVPNLTGNEIKVQYYYHRNFKCLLKVSGHEFKVKSPLMIFVLPQLH